MSNILINFAIGSYADPTAMPPDRAKIIGIYRHRLSTDGDGVTSLVAFSRLTVIFIIVIVLFAGCTYRSDSIVDNGVWLPIENGESVGSYTNLEGHIYWGTAVGDFSCDEIDVDLASFRVCSETEYAKDKRHVYYPQRIICYDGIDENGNGFGGTYAEEMILKGANPNHFRYLGNGYAVAGNRMYLNGETIEWKDSIVHHYNGDLGNSDETLIDSIEAVYPKVWVWDYDSLRENSSHINTVYPIAPDSLIYLCRYYESGKMLSEGWCLQDWNRETFVTDYIGEWKYFDSDGNCYHKFWNYTKTAD